MGRRLDTSRIETRMIPIEAIEDHPRNYNAHPDAQVAQLAESHKEFGQYRTILVWARPGGKYIRVVGHGYSAGARKTGETMLRAEVLPEDTPPDVVEAIMLADNLHAQNSSPDEDLLQQLLSEQADAGVNLGSLGTDDLALADLLAKLAPPPSLDDLAEAYGSEPEPDAFWPVIRLKVSPLVKETFDSLMEEAPGEEASAKLAWILERVNLAEEEEEIA